MMSQYLALKEKYSDCLLFFRLGDFYEMFFEDAVTASKVLDIALTGRDCGLETRAPMCGVPFHAVDSYIAKLIENGYKVALCEQLTDPALSKGLVERDVVRVYTAGTVIEENMLDERANNYIIAMYASSDEVGLACCDVSTGSFTVSEISIADKMDDLVNELARIAPREAIANEAYFLREDMAKSLQLSCAVTCADSRDFEPTRAEAKVLMHFRAASLQTLGCDALKNAVCAAGALISYLEQTQKNSLEHIKKLTVLQRSLYLGLDASTRRNLELTKPLHTDSGKKSTLLYHLDKTSTSMGARFLRAAIEQPLQSIDAINERLNAVDELVNKRAEREELSSLLDNIYDIERLCSRIAYGSVNGRDCVSLRVSLEKLPTVIEKAHSLESEAFCRIAKNLDAMEDICALLRDAIVDDPPIGVKDGGVIRAGYNSEVGYYIEVTKAYQHLVPYGYIRKQTLANSERYVTEELKELEEKITGAESNLISLEYKLFTEIRETLLGCIDRLQSDSALIAELDFYCSLAHVAFENNYCRPKMQLNGAINIVEGRHPVVESGMKGAFVPNNVQLDQKDNRLLIITGPNMAGKSTYLRQVAIITLMAHIGSFVPAKKAAITIVDRIFTRIGASDNLSGGQSTFMVEMSEVAGILNNATSRSLLILDEIGRGTSTFDGLSIAWAVLEYIADPARCGAKALFATHYHELTELEGKLPGIKNYRITVKEVGDDIIFLRRIVRGGADRSFGVQVARLAGLPDDVIARAKELLKQLEAADINHDIEPVLSGGEDQQMSLFGSCAADDIIGTLSDMQLDTMTPMDAMNALYDLQMRAKLRKGKK